MPRLEYLRVSAVVYVFFCLFPRAHVVIIIAYTSTSMSSLSRHSMAKFIYCLSTWTLSAVPKPQRFIGFIGFGP